MRVRGGSHEGHAQSRARSHPCARGARGDVGLVVRRNVAAFFNEAWAYGFLPAGARLGGARCALLDVAPRLHADGPWANDCRCRLSRERRVGGGADGAEGDVV